MKKTLILMAAAASVMLTGCTENDLSGDTSLAKETTSAIEFSAKTRSAGSTRAGATGIIVDRSATSGNKLGNTSYEFGVFGYQINNNTWSAGGSSATPNFMYNQKVVYNSTNNAWEYDPIKYWPNGTDAANAANSPSNTATSTNKDNLNFFAYAPYVALGDEALSGVGITKINNQATKGGASSTGNQKTGDPTVEYKLSIANLHTAANVDLLWGLRGDATYSQTSGTNSTGTVGTDYNVDLTKQTVAEKVSFLFKHALAKIGGKNGLKIVADIDGNGAGLSGYGTLDSKTCITVRSITIKNKGDEAFNESGTFDLATGEWSSLTPASPNPANEALINENISVSPNIVMNTDIYDVDGTPEYNTSGGSWTPAGVTTTAKDVYNAEGQDAFYLIPGSTLTLTVAINYDITTYDANVNNSYVKINQTITNNVTVSIPANATNKFYTLVLHLGLTSVKFSAEVADWDNAEAGAVEEIWLPSNVVSESTSVSLAAGKGATVNTAASTTSYAINLTGLTNSNKVYCSAVSGTGIANTSAVSLSPATITDAGTSTATVTMTANESTENAVSNTVTIVEYTDADNDGVYDEGETVVSTTVVTIIQAKAGA